MTRTKKKNQLSVTNSSHANMAIRTGSAPSQDEIRAMEVEILKAPQVDVGTTHLIHAGMYARTVKIPAGTLVTGVPMSDDHVCIISGDITFTAGADVIRLTGYNVIPASKGLKRIVYAHQETSWTAIFKSGAATIDEAEIEMSAEYDKLQSRGAGKCLEQ